MANRCGEIDPGPIYAASYQNVEQQTMETRKPFKELIQGTQPILVDFSAEWCGPCKMMAPILKELAVALGDGVSIIKIDVDKNPSVSKAYQVQSVPTLILFQNGNILWRQSGVVTAKQLENTIRKLAAV
jgi:thioredoxin 1